MNKYVYLSPFAKLTTQLGYTEMCQAHPTTPMPLISNRPLEEEFAFSQAKCVRTAGGTLMNALVSTSGVVH